MDKNIILYIAMSLDGYIAKQDGSVDWLTKYEIQIKKKETLTSSKRLLNSSD